MLEAHPMGLGFCDLKYKDGVLTFSTRIFYSDFYYDFMQTSSVKNKQYEKAGFDKKDLAELRSYFKKRIKIYINKKEVKFTKYTYKFEQHESDAYIFIVTVSANVKLKKGDKVKISDAVLLDSIGNQKNMINVYLDGTDEMTHGLITLDKKNPVFEFVN